MQELNVEKRNSVETGIILPKNFDFEQDLDLVKSYLKKWIDNELLNKGVGWVAIFKSLDELRIVGTGYNSPPLAELNFDIEKLPKEVANMLGESIYRFFKRKFGHSDDSEYLTYYDVPKYTKEENKGKEYFDEILNGDKDVSHDEYLYSGNAIYNLMSAVHENGNCRVYTRPNALRQVVYDFFIDKTGKLNVTFSRNVYDEVPWKEEVDSTVNLEVPDFTFGKTTIDVKAAIADIIIESQYPGKMIVTSHKPLKKVMTSFATDELFSYLNKMYSIFDKVSDENFLEENNLLAHYVKGERLSQFNILTNVSDYSFGINMPRDNFYENIGNMFLSMNRFNEKVYKAMKEWKSARNGELSSSHGISGKH